MIITRLKLTNWRNFTDVDVPLLDRAFIIGPNASGKSNLLDAIRFLRDVGKREGGGLQAAVRLDEEGCHRYVAFQRPPVAEWVLKLISVTTPANPLSGCTDWSLQSNHAAIIGSWCNKRLLNTTVKHYFNAPTLKT